MTLNSSLKWAFIQSVVRSAGQRSLRDTLHSTRDDLCCPFGPTYCHKAHTCKVCQLCGCVSGFGDCRVCGTLSCSLGLCISRPYSFDQSLCSAHATLSTLWSQLAWLMRFPACSSSRFWMREVVVYVLLLMAELLRTVGQGCLPLFTIWTCQISRACPLELWQLVLAGVRLVHMSCLSEESLLIPARLQLTILSTKLEEEHCLIVELFPWKIWFAFISIHCFNFFN